tara:strand:- start:13739 stop:14671 length:933 start_codon:yes stop_codon:yes gene_type:complete
VADYTKLSIKETQNILNLYLDETVRELKPLSLGISNSNYCVVTDHNEYLLKVSNDKNKSDTKQEMKLLIQLGERHFPYSLIPFVTKDSNTVYEYEEYFGVLFPFLKGIPPGPSDQTCYKIGKGLGQLHSLKFSKDEVRDHSDVGFDAKDLINFCEKPNCPNDFKEVIHTFFPKGLDSYTDSYPQGIVHGDLYYDNTLFKNQELEAFLDFEQAGWGDQLLDLGISLSGTCLEKGRIHPLLIESYLEGYYETSPVKNFANDLIDKSIILGLLSISRWRIERFNVKNLNPHMVDSYKELINKVYVYAQTKGIK